MYPHLCDVQEQLYFIYAGPTPTCGAINYRATSEITSEITAAIAKGKDTIVFYNISEPLTVDSLSKINLCASLIPTRTTMYYATGSLDGEEVYNQLAKDHKWNSDLKILSSNSFENITKENLIKTVPEPYNPMIRPKTFLCFNRIERPHRINLIGKLIKKDLLHTGFCSMYGHNYNNGWIYSTIMDTELIEPDIKEIIIKNKDQFPMHLSGDKDTRNNPIDILDIDRQLFRNSYYSLVTETLFYKNEKNSNMCYSVFFSEKTFKPIIMKHPFILVAPPYYLKWLKQTGYKTFSPYIDESYDEEEDDTKRLNMIVNEVQRLNDFTADQWIDWQKKVAETVEFNYNVLMNKTEYTVGN